jgi:hypothetical protein
MNERAPENAGEGKVRYDPGETYRFVPQVGRRVLENVGISAVAGAVLTSFLFLPLEGGAPPVRPPTALLLGAGAMLFCFVGMSFQYLSRKNARWIEVSPKGLRFERRDGMRFERSFEGIRGYVYNGVSLNLAMPEGGVGVNLAGLTDSQKALLIEAVRTPMKQGSLQWRGKPPEPVRGGRAPLFVTIILIVLAYVLARQGRNVLAAMLILVMLIYNLHAFLTRTKR